MNGKHLVAAIYYHPEVYPPTLNAVEELSKQFDSITIVHRPHLKGTWNFPDNVSTIASGRPVSVKQQETSGMLKKILFFARFVIDLYKESVRKKPAVMLMYDVRALYAYSVIRPFLFFKHILWYHNHDISELQRERKYSIGWLACKAERKMFAHIDLFTLPSIERVKYFPVETLKGKYFVVPNYPSLKFYRQFYQPEKPLHEVCLVFQGGISEGHGLEEIVPLLAETIAGKKMRMILMGNCSPVYMESLLQLAASYNATDRISFNGFTPYKEVPRIAASCHIGIAIYSKTETNWVTLGTASNKIYEYAAVGLPVIYSDKPHFTRYLSKYPWAFAVQQDTASIRQQLIAILSNYAYYANSAHASFLEELNFENCFSPVTSYLRLPENSSVGG